MATEKVKTETTDPWSEMVDIFIEKPVNGEPNYLIASVNGRVFKLKRGGVVRCPRPIAEVINNSRRSQNEAEAFNEKVSG